jgi:hypothetical protein
MKRNITNNQSPNHHQEPPHPQDLPNPKLPAMLPPPLFALLTLGAILRNVSAPTLRLFRKAVCLMRILSSSTAVPELMRLGLQFCSAGAKVP